MLMRDLLFRSSSMFRPTGGGKASLPRIRSARTLQFHTVINAGLTEDYLVNRMVGRTLSLTFPHSI
jgi:hypothetical protein